MNTAICYYSRHHGNTLKLLEAIRDRYGAELVDVTARSLVRLECFDAVGFASGIYRGRFHPTVTAYLTRYLPEGKPVFFLCTYGMKGPGYTRAITRAAGEKHAPILGAFGCPGWDTFGPFGLVGGIAKGRPHAGDVDRALDFYQRITAGK